MTAHQTTTYSIFGHPFISLAVATSTCLAMAASASPPAGAQDLLPTLAIYSENKIQSWSADPYMSQEEEKRIIGWLKSRPKSTQHIDFISELQQELVAASKLHAGVEVAFNYKSLADLGLEPESKAHELENSVLPPGNDLIGMLAASDLTYMVRRGMIEITTYDDAFHRPVVRVYDISPLLPIVKLNGRSVVSSGPVIDTIQCIVEPDSWEALGGTGSIQDLVVNNRCLLIISTISDIHIQVQAMLDQMVTAGQIVHLPKRQSVVTGYSLTRQRAVFHVSDDHKVDGYSRSTIPTSSW